MDYETFLKFFETMAKKKIMNIGSYTVEYDILYHPVGVGHDIIIWYYKDGNKIGRDYINEFYDSDNMVVNTLSSYEISGIKNFNKLIDYLDYLYNILKEKKKQQEQRRVEYLKEEERKQKKVDDFINPS